jgi:TonB family protein
MDAFAMYLLKSVIWLSGFALVFILFLRNERFFFLNRLYLIAGILTSFLLPFISIRYNVILPVTENIQEDGVNVLNGIQNVVQISTPDVKTWLSGFYLSGVLFVIIMIVRQGRSIIRAIKRAEINKSHSINLIRTAEYPSSFSFFSYVFVNPSITDIETEEIVNHEIAHIRQWHWFDLVLVELLCILQWFNPLVWIYVRFIKQNHEYLADEVALQRTSDPAIYRAVLLNQIVGYPVVSLANSFNYSLNSKRFKMMKNIISSPYRKMKILFILPVFAIVLYSFAKPEYRYVSINENSVIKDPVSAAFTKEVKGTVVQQQDGSPLEGAIVIVKGTMMGSSTDAKGYFRIENVPDEAELTVTYVGFKSKVLKPVFTSDMIIKMVKDTLKFLDADLSTPPPPPPPPPPPQQSPASPSTNADNQKADKDVFVVVEELPEFPGGGHALTAWIINNLKYPGEAVKGKITGKVFVDFMVSSTGKVKNVQVNKSVHPLLDAEAKRVISNMPDWKPGSQSGKPIDVQMLVPVEFKLK